MEAKTRHKPGKSRAADTAGARKRSSVSPVEIRPRPMPGSASASTAESAVGRPAPRIYYAAPLLVGAAAAWPAQFARIRQLGFNTVLIAPPFRPGRSGSVFAPADFDQLHPALGDQHHASAAAYLGDLAAGAAAEGLGLFVDLAIDRIAADAPIAAENRDWFGTPIATDADPPDPRRPAQASEAVHARYGVASAREGLTREFSALARALVSAGVRGFRCLAPQAAPAEVWRQIIAAARATATEVAFCAWTPGLDAATVAALADAGFDFSFASTPWWDMRSPWLFTEYEARRLILPSIGLVEDPAGPRLASGLQNLGAAEARAILARRVWIAATTGRGWLMPMGFEYGATRPLDAGGGRPADWEWLASHPLVDLSEAIIEANRAMAEQPSLSGSGAIRLQTSPDAAVTALLRTDAGDFRGADKALATIVNRLDDRAAAFDPSILLTAFPGLRELRPLLPEAGPTISLDAPVTLGPGGATILAVDCTPLRTGEIPKAGVDRRSAEAAAAASRLVIEAVQPTTGDPTLAIKRIVGDTVEVEADIYGDGHEKLAAAVRWRRADDQVWQEAPMRPIGNDRWRGSFRLKHIGKHVFTVEAWRDLFATWRDEVEKKHAAGLNIDLELREGKVLLARAAAHAQGDGAARLASLTDALANAETGEALSLLFAEDAATTVASSMERVQVARAPAEFSVYADRREAGFASWYEMFPRSAVGDKSRHGTFDDVIAWLPYVRRMGFDVLYFTPIHPIGRTNRKGRNNTLSPAPDDPGSPYAIGAAEGGHDALHPELGDVEAFQRLLREARGHGLEIALDFAIQCSPEHPWLQQHPQWFAWRPDGSLRYAENPPKKYEDIVNVDFYAEAAVPELWTALRDVILHWIEQGIRTFRVDNPHTKPLPFWQWLIADVQGRHPDAIFLSEAFTRPKMMKRLAKIGFTQSYTYFTWRRTKAELIEYLTELTTTEMREYYRPHFFVNTPDINPAYLHHAGRAMFQLRAALAATLSGLWGVYCGFEFCEGSPMPGKEEYLDSEKYEIRAWDWNRPGNIVDDIARLNRIRHENPALHSHLGLTFMNCWNDSVICYRKSDSSRGNVLLVAANLNPESTEEAAFEVPLWEFGLPDSASVRVEDLMRNRQWIWTGKVQQVRFESGDLPFSIWRISPVTG